MALKLAVQKHDSTSSVNALRESRRVARIWKRRGLFWKSETTASDLDPNFHCCCIRITRLFRPKLEIRTVFQPKNRWSPKKKGLHRNWDGFFGQIWKFKQFFRPNHGNYFIASAPKFLWGGCFHFFSKNRPQNHQKQAILHTLQAKEGLEPPLATLLREGSSYC